MANNLAQGDFSILINAQETEAKLIFIPNPDREDGWDVGAINKLCGDNNLAPPSGGVLEPFLHKAVKSKERLELVLYEGHLPEEATPELVSWEPLEVPPEISPHVEETLHRAPPPYLVKTKIERVKREILAVKPNKFPFLPPKEEIEIVWDKREIQEPAVANPLMLEHRYGRRGQKLGIVAMPKTGKPGRSVFGKPIPPLPLTDIEFFLGRGLRREKNEIWCEVSGILRIGANWADIVPLATPSWEINSGIGGLNLLLQFHPGDARFPAPDAEEILKAAAEKVPGAEFVSAEEVAQAIAMSRETGEELVAFSLFPVREALAEVEISSDRVSAVLRLRKGLAGARPLEMKAISQAILDSKIKGFDKERLKTVVKEFMSGAELSLDYVLAQGRPPSRGEDKEVKIRAPALSPEASKIIMERLASYAPYGTLEKRKKLFPLTDDMSLYFVGKDDPAAEIIASDSGEAGMDIFGETLPGIPGNDPELHLYQGLYQRGALLLAGRPGLLMVRGTSREFWGQILDYRDASISVLVSEDGMTAAADLTSHFGAGAPLSMESIKGALAHAGVTQGIDEHALHAALKTAESQGSCVNAVLARGRPPVAAEGSAITWLLEIPAYTRMNVDAGIALAELTYVGAEGRPGYDVLGTTLPPEHGAKDPVSFDSSILEMPREDVENSRYLVSARAGELSFDGKVLGINDLREIEGDVGPETGNIDFPGKVRIAGRVNPGYSVVGADDVFITGTAEAALISSGGKVTAFAGINGEGRGIIRARKVIDAAMADRATLMAVGDIRIKGDCTLSNIKTNGRLLLTGRPGRLAGGICQARRGVDAVDIGSENESRTEISFGQDYLIKDQIEVTERDIGKVKEALEELEKDIARAAGKPSILAEARSEKVRSLKLLDRLNLKIFTLREKFEEHYDSEIRVRGTIYPGVVMESHDRYYEIIQKRSKVVFYFDRKTGRIAEKSLVGKDS